MSKLIISVILGLVFTFFAFWFTFVSFFSSCPGAPSGAITECLVTAAGEPLTVFFDNAGGKLRITEIMGWVKLFLDLIFWIAIFWFFLKTIEELRKQKISKIILGIIWGFISTFLIFQFTSGWPLKVCCLDYKYGLLPVPTTEIGVEIEWIYLLSDLLFWIIIFRIMLEGIVKFNEREQN